ncbi:MAG: hypothetical protein QXY41_05925 [Thermoproteota archaeon]
MSRRSSGRLTASIHLRLTNDELEFIEMISKKTGLSLSEAVRLAINMFRIILALEAVDVDKVSEAVREASLKALDDAREEGWLKYIMMREKQSETS